MKRKIFKIISISIVGMFFLGCESAEEKQAKEIMAKKVIEADIKQKEFRESMKKNDERRFTPNLNKDKE